MNYFKRAVTSIMRRPGKSLTLLLMLFVLGNVIAGAISIQQAVLNTEANLRASLSTITIIEQDWNAINDAFANNEMVPNEAFVPLPSEIIKQIGNLEYVSSFDYSFVMNSGFDAILISETLNRAELDLAPNLLDVNVDLGSFTDWNSRRQTGSDFEQFTLRGVHRPEMMEMSAGIITLDRGRLFTESEVADGSLVAIVSQAFAHTNNLQLESTFTLDQIIFDNTAFEEAYPFGWGGTERFNRDFFLDSESLEFEVVGIFTPELDLDFSGNNIGSSIDILRDYNNRIYTPNDVILQINRRNREQLFNQWLEAGRDIGVSSLDENTMLSTNLFALESPRDLNAFHEAATHILGDLYPWWRAVDVSNTFGVLSSSMDNMLMIANMVMWVAIGTTIIIITLLITLFLRDRKQEIGVYLALGEKRGRIISQILLEVLSVSLIALVLSIFSGNMLSTNISTQLLHNDLLAQETESPWLFEHVDIPWELRAFAPEPMTLDEMIEAYDTSMNATTVLIFLGVGMGTVLVSAVIPIGYITRFDPKKIML